METFFLKLAVATIPLILLVAAITATTVISEYHHNNSRSRYRTRRAMLKALAAGTMLR